MTTRDFWLAFGAGVLFGTAIAGFVATIFISKAEARLARVIDAITGILAAQERETWFGEDDGDDDSPTTRVRCDLHAVPVTDCEHLRGEDQDTAVLPLIKDTGDR